MNLEKQSLSFTPDVGPLRQIAVRVLVNEIDNIIRNPKPHQYKRGGKKYKKKLKFELYLKGVDHKYDIEFDSKHESTTIFRADILTTVTRDCIPKAAVEQKQDIATEERYAKSLIRALDYHYTLILMSLLKNTSLWVYPWATTQCCGSSTSAPAKKLLEPHAPPKKKTPSTSTQGKGSKEKTGQDSPSTPQHAQKPKPRRLKPKTPST